MTVLRATGSGFRLTLRLWIAVAAYSVANAFVSFLGSFLPHQVVNDQIQKVPLPKDPNELLALAISTFAVFLVMVVSQLYLLGGVLGCLQRMLRKQSVEAGEYFRQCREKFWFALKWGMVAFLFLLGIFCVGSFLSGLLWAITGHSAESRRFILVIGFGATQLLGLPFLLYSPFFLLENGGRIRDGFRGSYRFSMKRKFATVRLIFWVSLIVAIFWLADFFLPAPMIGRVRAALGIAPFAAGFPSFFFNLVLLLPQAFMSVYLPAVLYTYYVGQTASAQEKGRSA